VETEGGDDGKMKALEVLDRCLALPEGARRLRELLKQPDDDHTKDWFMCVPLCFNKALDIKQTTVEGPVNWTQGSMFSFGTGDILYDTPEAYVEWRRALRHMKLAVQVEEATDAVPEKRGRHEALRVSRNPGSVLFRFLCPNRNQSSLVHRGQSVLTQDEFVRFLIVGPDARLKLDIDRQGS